MPLPSPDFYLPYPASLTPFAIRWLPSSIPVPASAMLLPTALPAVPVAPSIVSPRPRLAAPTTPPTRLVKPPTVLPTVEVTNLTAAVAPESCWPIGIAAVLFCFACLWGTGKEFGGRGACCVDGRGLKGPGSFVRTTYVLDGQPAYHLRHRNFLPATQGRPCRNGRISGQSSRKKAAIDSAHDTVLYHWWSFSPTHIAEHKFRGLDVSPNSLPYTRYSLRYLA
jgi:hypothetical protein